MKNKTINYLYALWFILAGMFMCACGNPISEEEAHDYIEGYTSKYFGGDKGKFMVAFCEPVLKDKEKVDGLMEISPSVRGRFVKSDDYTLCFVPDSGAISFGKEYDCKVKIGELFKREDGKEIDDFKFTVEAITPKATMKEMSVRVDPTDNDAVVLNGKLMMSCIVSPDKIKPEMFTVDGKKTDNIKITEGERPGTYNISVSGVKKDTKPSDMGDLTVKRVKFDGSAFGIENETDMGFDVPIKGVFEPLCAVEDVKDDDISLTVYFSERLDPTQSVEGLVYLPHAWRDNERAEAKTEKFDDYIKLTLKTWNCARNEQLHVSEGIKSNTGKKIESEITLSYEKTSDKPEVRIFDEGLILADVDNVKITVGARNLFAVDVDILKIYPNNVLGFLREESDYDGTLRRYGRFVYHKTVRLDNEADFDITKKNTYSIDLKDFVAKDPGAIYKVYLSFKKDYTIYNAGADSRSVELRTTNKVSDKAEDVFDSDGYVDMSDALGFAYWSNSDDPEEESYYTWNRCVASHTYMVSNLGVTVKKSDSKKIWVAVTDIKDADPMRGVKITAYNYQLQEIGEGSTDGDGFCEIECKNSPFYVVAEKDGRRSYVKTGNGSELSYSRFNVSGEEKQKGVKAFIYGERNVWRPGDTLYLSVMVEDSEKKLPERCPVTAEMYTPQGQYYMRKVSRNGVNGLYTFTLPTHDDCQTGLWRVVFEIGGRKFTQYVRIATIKPNRLKINIEPKGEEMGHIALQSNWLTGSAASGLKYKVEAEVASVRNPFPKYKTYTFTNPTSSYENETIEISEGTLNGTGYAKATDSDMNMFYGALKENEYPSLMLNATVIARVFEKGGDASITAKDYKIPLANKYVGIDLSNKTYETDKDLKFDVVVLDKNGKKVSDNLRYRICKLEWSWWEEYSSYSLRQFVSGNSKSVVAEGKLKANGGTATVPFRIDYPSWGKYLVYVESESEGSAAGGIIDIDWPSYRGMSDKGDATAATMVMFSTDKEVYEVGEDATVYIPAAKEAKALVSVECGGRVLSREWVDAKDEMKPHKIKMTKEMTPNCYIAMSLIWPHKVTEDGLPIRKYGVIPVKVENKESHLEPQIEMSDNIAPQKPFTIKVSEKNNKKMTYTLAIVDEGLLDITSFKTPDPWTAMNQKEALGVRTYDMFKDIINAKSSYFATILSVGGDLAAKKASQKEKRFKPVVKFVGPFTLEKGTKEHKLQLPMYVGSVRVMVVACNGDKAYGSTDKSVTVSSPLMTLVSLPRVLTNGETLKLPVNVFSTVKNGQEATISVEVDGPLSIVGEKSKKVSFTAPSDKMVYFDLKTDGTKEGMAHVKIKASSSVMTTNDEVAIEVRNPQPYLVDSDTRLVKDKQNFEWTAFAKSNTNSAVMTVSPMPNINVMATYDMMTAYPYRCSEQVSSRLLFFLNAEKFLSDNQKEGAKKQINEMLTMLYERQLPNGGFCYWPGSEHVNEWVTNMAGHALLTAKDKGYNVSDEVIRNWQGFQQGRARAYVIGKYDAATTQAYRLYTLALAKNADEASMNKLKEDKVNNEPANALLASAYALVGKKNVATQILGILADTTNKDKGANRYEWSEEWTFGSHIRDKALYLEALALAGDKDNAMELAENLSCTFDTRYASTSEAAYAMVAMNRLSNIVSTTIEKAQVKWGNQTKEIKNSDKAETIEIDCSAGKCEVLNSSDKPLFASLCLRRKPSTTEEIKANSNGMEIAVKYYDNMGKDVQLGSLKQGDEITASVTVRNTSNDKDARMVALNFGWASGIEPWNDIAADDDCDYTDQRDDKKIWHFTLRRNAAKTFTMKLRAAFCGEYIMPSALAEDMYDAAINARTSSGAVKIRN